MARQTCPAYGWQRGIRRWAGDDCVPDPAGRDIPRDPDRHLDLRLRPAALGLPLARHRGPRAEGRPEGGRGLERPEWLQRSGHRAVLALHVRPAARRSSAMDILAQDYIRTARAKGLSERLVLLRHLLRNACLPMITLIGLSIPALLAGKLIGAVLTVVGNLVADVALTIADPRIRLR